MNSMLSFLFERLASTCWLSRQNKKCAISTEQQYIYHQRYIYQIFQLLKQCRKWWIDRVVALMRCGQVHKRPNMNSNIYTYYFVFWFDVMVINMYSNIVNVFQTTISISLTNKKISKMENLNPAQHFVDYNT